MPNDDGKKRARFGSCLCGRVRYHVVGEMRDVIACHCTQCRKTTGHFLAAAQASLANFQLIEKQSLKWFRASDIAARGFCGACGSTLFWRPDDGDTISIAAGSLDGHTGLKICEHIFVADKGDYYQLDTNIPQFDADH